jgi:hypothetical protein
MEITTEGSAGHFSRGKQDSIRVGNGKGQWYMSYDNNDGLWGKPTDLSPTLGAIITVTEIEDATCSKVTKAFAMDDMFASKCTLESIVNIPTKQQLLSLAHFHGIGVQLSLDVHLQSFLSVNALINIVMEYSMMYNDLLQIGISTLY